MFLHRNFIYLFIYIYNYLKHFYYFYLFIYYYYYIILYYCAADFALLNLPKGKSLGRSKPATNSSNEQAH